MVSDIHVPGMVSDIHVSVLCQIYVNITEKGER